MAYAGDGDEGLRTSGGSNGGGGCWVVVGLPVVVVLVDSGVNRIVVIMMVAMRVEFGDDIEGWWSKYKFGDPY